MGGMIRDTSHELPPGLPNPYAERPPSRKGDRVSDVETMVWAIEVQKDADGNPVEGFYPSPTAKYVAAALSRRAWATGRIGWSQAALARDTGMSARTIWTALRDLEGVKLIRREPIYVDNLRKADRLIFTLRAVTITLEPLSDGDFDEDALAKSANAAPASQNLRGEPVANIARGKPKTPKTSEAKASSSGAKRKSPKKKPEKMHLVPEDWEPKDAHREKVSAFGWPDGMFDEQLARFREWEFAAGKTDFDRAFHRWLRTHNDDLKGRSNDYRSNRFGAGSGPGRGPAPRGERLDAMRGGAMGAIDRFQREGR